MTERGAPSLSRGADWLVLGPSDLRWDGSGLTLRIDEITAPWPRRIRGTVRLFPSAIETRTLALDETGRHLWRPIAPCADVEVALEHPALTWRGHGYFDSNTGDRALEDDFRSWHWYRASVPGGTVVQYDVDRWPPDAPLSLAMRYDARGGVEDLPPLVPGALPSTRWRVQRRIGAREGHIPEVVSTLEDTPFYARSIVATSLADGPAVAVHESLSLERFRAPWVQAMLPFRMPRAPR